MKSLPINISSFSDLILKDCIYVDKTKYIYDLFTSKSPYYFLARPRRFGKSLLISTLQELFSSNKELFKDQWIATSDYNWQEYIVLNFDFLSIAHENPENLKDSLDFNINTIAIKYGINLSGKNFVDRFSQLLDELGQRAKIVLLVDEYDQPIIKYIDDLKLANAMRDIVKNFYDVVKSKFRFFKAIFITGVTKFAKTSVMSGLNNLEDLTLNPDADKLLGYTEFEIAQYFKSYIEQIEKQRKLHKDQIFAQLKEWYNGYRFSFEEVKVYNPYSVLFYLKNQIFENYWFQTGMPTLLIKLARKQLDSLEEFTDIELTKDMLGTFEIEQIPIIPLLFQTGYLTIAAYNPEKNTFKLDYPNKEVKDSFNSNLVAGLAYVNRTNVAKGVGIMSQALRDNDVEAFCEALKSLFAHIPYNLHIPQERYFHSLFQFLGVLLGLELQSEVATDKGRMDLSLQTAKHIFVFELKFNSSAEVALKQIEDKKYYQKFLIYRKPITLVGLNFAYVNEQLELECKSKTAPNRSY